MRAKDALGKYGEDLAADYLQRSGLIIMERNYRCRSGEVDILARDENVLVVCEVKTRTSEHFGSPLAAVTPIKLRRMRRVAMSWVTERGVRPPQIRFDVIGIVHGAGNKPTLEHVRDVA
ncbi:MAG: YraN family protein [Candidatus Nanopelagicales bacterium]|jgi:putative endonuclease